MKERMLDLDMLGKYNSFLGHITENEKKGELFYHRDGNAKNRLHNLRNTPAGDTMDRGQIGNS